MSKEYPFLYGRTLENKPSFCSYLFESFAEKTQNNSPSMFLKKINAQFTSLSLPSRFYYILQMPYFYEEWCCYFHCFLYVRTSISGYRKNIGYQELIYSHLVLIHQNIHPNYHISCYKWVRSICTDMKKTLKTLICSKSKLQNYAYQILIILVLKITLHNE